MKKPRMDGWTKEEIRLYEQGFKQGRLYERHLCLDDCGKVYERCDDRESAGVYACIEEIQERAEKDKI